MVGGPSGAERAPQGSYREVIGVAWPIVISMLSYTFMGVADTFMVSSLGTAEVAGTGLAVVGVFTLTSFGWGIVNAVKVAVAQAYGAGKRQRTIDATVQGLIIALGLGCAVLLLLPCSDWLIRSLGGRGDVHRFALDYFDIRLLGAIPMYVSLSAFGYFQGLGDTRTPMKVQVVANVLNVGLDYVLIYGLGPIPSYGVEGAAMATVVAFSMQGLVSFIWFCRATAGRRRSVWEGTREILDLGVPMGVRFWLEVLSWSVFTGILARFGDAHLAAHVIAIRIISVSFLPGHGIGEAACVLTGQAVGAGDEQAARRVAKVATRIGLVAMGLCALGFLAFGKRIVGVFQPEPDVLELGTSLLLIASAFQLFDAVAMIKQGALNGAGDTRFTMLVGVGAAWLVLVPLGWLLCSAAGWGAPGAWVALTVHIAVLAFILSQRWEGSPSRLRAATGGEQLAGQLGSK